MTNFPAVFDLLLNIALGRARHTFSELRYLRPNMLYRAYRVVPPSLPVLISYILDPIPPWGIWTEVLGC